MPPHLIEVHAQLTHVGNSNIAVVFLVDVDVMQRAGTGVPKALGLEAGKIAVAQAGDER